MDYGLINISADKLEEAFTLEKKVYVSNYPWNRESAPIEEKRIPSWNIYIIGRTGPIPHSITYGLETEKQQRR